MNASAPQVYSEIDHRLAVGFEPIDSLRRTRLTHTVRVDLEGANTWSPRDPSEPYRAGTARRRWRRAMAKRDQIYPRDLLPRVDRHDSGVQVLLVRPELGETLELRLYEYDRRYVPRRFRLELDPLPQVRRPVLFPGAAYDLSPRTTGLRGRVTRAGEPMRWARVDARLCEPDVLVGRTHGDDRGEFLLVLAPEAAPFAELSDPLTINVKVFGPRVPPVAPPPSIAQHDAYWDLPLEVLGKPTDSEPVAAGKTLPDNYITTSTSTRLVQFRLGRVISGADGVSDFEF